MNKCKYLVFSILIFAIFISCGNKEHEQLGYDISGIDTRISRILINRTSYEGALVKLLGRVKQLEITRDSITKRDIMQFDLTDTRSNFIKVVSNEIVDLEEDDVVVLSGIYDSKVNEITLEKFEKQKLE